MFKNVLESDCSGHLNSTKLKEDEPAPDGQQMVITPLDHSGNQAGSRPNASKRRPSTAGPLAASRLVKKARLSLLPKSNISLRPSATKSTSNNITAPEVQPGDLSKETIDSIFENSCSTLSFATRLMLHLFDQTELHKCQNVYGRSGLFGYQIQNPDEALDERRVNTIRRLLEEKAEISDRTWKECVSTMNRKIGRMKR